MLDAGRTLYDVAFADELLRLSLFLEVPAALGNYQDLPARIFVPIEALARFEVCPTRR